MGAMRLTETMPTTVYTIGHSTHSIDDFFRMLRANDVSVVVDVRTIPGSRHNPQFGQHELSKSLHSHAIEYVWKNALGGLRHTTKSSINSAWRNTSFRGYADYMQTPEFDAAIDDLISLAKSKTIVIMCAEAVPWRCHRSLIGDALLARGIVVADIMSETSTKPHTLTAFARVDGTRVWYPATEDDSDHSTATRDRQ